MEFRSVLSQYFCIKTRIKISHQIALVRKVPYQKFSIHSLSFNIDQKPTSVSESVTETNHGRSWGPEVIPACSRHASPATVGGGGRGRRSRDERAAARNDGPGQGRWAPSPPPTRHPARLSSGSDPIKGRVESSSQQAGTQSTGFFPVPRCPNSSIDLHEGFLCNNRSEGTPSHRSPPSIIRAPVLSRRSYERPLPPPPGGQPLLLPQQNSLGHRTEGLVQLPGVSRPSFSRPPRIEGESPVPCDRTDPPPSSSPPPPPPPPPTPTPEGRHRQHSSLHSPPPPSPSPAPRRHPRRCGRPPPPPGPGPHRRPLSPPTGVPGSPIPAPPPDGPGGGRATGGAVGSSGSTMRGHRFTATNRREYFFVDSRAALLAPSPPGGRCTTLRV